MQTSAWLILLFPLAGTIVIGLGYRVMPDRVVGLDRDRRHRRRVRRRRSRPSSRSRAATRSERQVVYVAWDYANTVGVDGKISILVDPLSVFMALVVTGVSTLIHLYSVAYMHERPRLRALLRLPELLRLLDARAGDGGQLPAAHHRLGLRRRRVLPADLVLVPAHDGDSGRHQGVRHQRGRRRRARPGHVLHLPPLAHAGLPGHLRLGLQGLRRAQRGADRGAASCCSSARSRSRPRSRCTPGSRTRWRARRRSPRSSTPPPWSRRASISSRACTRSSSCRTPPSLVGDHRRLRDAAGRRDDRPRGDRPQARHRLLDDVADRLHGHGRERGRVRRPGSSTS